MPPIDLDGGAIRVGRSAVTTTEERKGLTADPEEVRVKRVVWFDLSPDALPDQTHRYGVQTFAPRRARAQWDNGVLTGVKVDGPLRLKDGRVSTNTASIRETEWETWRAAFDRSLMPEALASAIENYEFRANVGQDAARAKGGR